MQVAAVCHAWRCRQTAASSDHATGTPVLTCNPPCPPPSQDDFDARDPARPLLQLRDFLAALDKTVAELEAERRREAAQAAAAARVAALRLRTTTSATAATGAAAAGVGPTSSSSASADVAAAAGTTGAAHAEAVDVEVESVVDRAGVVLPRGAAPVAAGVGAGTPPGAQAAVVVPQAAA